MKANLPTAQIKDGFLDFDENNGFDLARAYGAFHLRYPKDMSFDQGVRFAQNYYLPPEGGPNDSYRGFNTKSLGETALGYSKTGNDQDELFQLESHLWAEYLPFELASLLNQIHLISKITLQGLFEMAEVPSCDWDKIAIGLTRDEALQYCIFNHFRSNVDEDIGLTAHKDSGFITTLYTTEAGLESLENGRWVSFDPLEGYFTIVLGHSLEILTKNKRKPISASYHRVRRTARRAEGVPDRFTFGTYIGPRWEQDLYQYSSDNELQVLQSFLDFQKTKAKEMNYEFHPNVKQPSAFKES